MESNLWGQKQLSVAAISPEPSCDVQNELICLCLPSIDSFFIALVTRPDWKRCQPRKPFVLGQVKGQSDPSGSLLPPRRGLPSSTEVLPHANGHVCLQRYL